MRMTAMGERGRIVLPVEVREALGIREGEKFVVEAQPDGSIRLVPLRNLVASTKGMYAHLEPHASWSDEVLRMRREEERLERS
jgi:AbrB family looped-hinge helix DNA binding protein